jgi:hypothetical protein
MIVNEGRGYSGDPVMPPARIQAGTLRKIFFLEHSVLMLDKKVDCIR